MEQKDTNNEQIIKVLSFIMSRLDSLEIEQSRHKEMFYKVRKNLTDANDLINQILDVLELENPELYNKTMEQYQNSHMKDLVSTLDKHIEELDDLNDDAVLELLMQIVGDA
jgi:predicted nuclease with TOPRIM domain|tara:strand:- start:134 stop:466 length:333 start_codon:yes stop_codon:yes gene_type:complete